MYVNFTQALTKFYQGTGPGVPGCRYVTDCKYGGPISNITCYVLHYGKLVDTLRALGATVQV